MVNINIWGPASWRFFHTAAANISESKFSTVGKQLVMFIVYACNMLPCPECTTHARRFWTSVKIDTITNKQRLINVLFLFHNTVSTRKRTQTFRYGDLQQYKGGMASTIAAYNSFSASFHTSNNTQLMTDEMQRKHFLKQFKRWMLLNIGAFNESN